MAHCATASDIKNRARRLHPEAPREGTYMREVFDIFRANKGLPVEFNQKGKNTAILRPLMDCWGLDIRMVEHGSSRSGRPSKYILAGEWFGRVYIDYVAERIEAAQ